jgi:hypothetical protein
MGCCITQFTPSLNSHKMGPTCFEQVGPVRHVLWTGCLSQPKKGNSLDVPCPRTEIMNTHRCACLTTTRTAHTLSTVYHTTRPSANTHSAYTHSALTLLHGMAAHEQRLHETDGSLSSNNSQDSGKVCLPHADTLTRMPPSPPAHSGSRVHQQRTLLTHMHASTTHPHTQTHITHFTVVRG